MARRPTRRSEFLDVIARHTLRMERLVRDLLRLARLDAGQEADRSRRRARSRALVAAAQTDLHSLLARAPSGGRACRSPSEAATVHGDPGQAPRRAAESSRKCEQLQPDRRHD